MVLASINQEGEQRKQETKELDEDSRGPNAFVGWPNMGNIESPKVLNIINHMLDDQRKRAENVEL